MTAIDVPTDHPPVQVALARAAAAVGAIPKDDKNEDQGFKYRGIERILAAVGPALHKAGVVVLPEVVDVHREEMVRGARQTVWRLVTLTVRYTFVGPGGDQLTATVLGEGLDNGDKAVSKAMTMALKVALLQALQIADAETDPDATTPPEQSAPTRQQGPVPLRPETLAKVQAGIQRDQLTDQEVREMVRQATDDRTDDLADVHEGDEYEALRAAKQRVLAERGPSLDPGRAFEPAGETTP